MSSLSSACISIEGAEESMDVRWRYFTIGLSMQWLTPVIRPLGNSDVPWGHELRLYVLKSHCILSPSKERFWACRLGVAQEMRAGVQGWEARGLIRKGIRWNHRSGVKPYPLCREGRDKRPRATFWEEANSAELQHHLEKDLCALAGHAPDATWYSADSNQAKAFSYGWVTIWRMEPSPPHTGKRFLWHAGKHALLWREALCSGPRGFRKICILPLATDALNTPYCRT